MPVHCLRGRMSCDELGLREKFGQNLAAFRYITCDKLIIFEVQRSSKLDSISLIFQTKLTC